VAVNREELDADGRIRVGRNPAGITDHSVEVFRVDDLNGKPIAVITNYAAHPVVMGYHTYLLSADYPGVVRRLVESTTGATCLFLTGAAGNQAALSFLQSDWGEQERMGGQIAGGHTRMFELICCDCGDNPYLDCSQQSSRPQKLRRPYAISGRLAPSGQHLRAVQPGHRRRVPQEPREEEAP